MLTLGDIKDLCSDYRVDHKTRMVAYGLFKTNRRAAAEYIKGYTRRRYIERQKITPSFGAG